MVKVDHVGIFVSDPKLSAEFYVHHLGFAIELEPPDGRMVAIKDDADFTIFLSRDRERASQAACDLFIQVDDVDAKHRHLAAAGVVFAKPPQKLLWGYGAELLDPDGYRVHLWDERSMRERG
ncbi:MAG TPA: VOC family protein [Myxococcota bacterium]|jgi:predicted enzyme related to lactoylglutathione lyase